jgi:integrase
MIDPARGKPFGNFITRSLGGTHHIPTAKKLRDIRLAEVRAMEANAAQEKALGDRFSLERASGWAEALRAQEAEGFDPKGCDVDVRGLIYDEIKKAPKPKRKAFKRVALAGTISFNEAVERYLHDRREGNGYGYAALKKTTQNDLRVAARYFCEYMDGNGDTVFLGDITREAVLDFRGEYLPAKTSPRAPDGLSLTTIEKHVGLLRNLWAWAVERSLTGGREDTPFDTPKGAPKEKPSTGPKRDMFECHEATAIMRAFPRGHRLGDIFRLSLVSGARATELAKVLVSDVDKDFSFYKITEGKTENAKRTIPVPSIAQGILEDRVRKAMEAKEDRLFYDFPLRPATDKASSLSQLFTRERRKLLGEETDGRLTFHSLRHTWFTKAGQAKVSERDAHLLGGWARKQSSSSPYDHGLLLSDLAILQEQVTERLRQDGYLEAF